ncbi:MAG: hypothetical protein WAX57_02755 [Minisyncoccia bacterium]
MSEWIAIVSYPTDLHAEHVLKSLADQGAKSVLLNLGEYPSGIQMSLGISNGDRAQVSLEISGETFLGDELKSVWWRRPLGAYRDECMDLEQRYIASEGEAVTRSLPDFLPAVHWISDPDATRMAGRKPRQLALAASLGFRIPDSVVGNSVAAVERFLGRNSDRPIILKAVNSAFIRLNTKVKDDEGVNRVVYTKLVQPDFIRSNLLHIAACPFILQEAISKTEDVRVTVVGDEVFAMGIRTTMKAGDELVVDWRKMDADRDYFRHELPDAIADLCRQVTHQLGLKFGCIDLAYSKDEGYTFFEINPQGQWLTSEVLLKYPITAALTALLLG